MKGRKIILTIGLVIILIPIILWYVKYNNTKKVTISKSDYELNGEVRMYSECSRAWGYEIKVEKIYGEVYKEIKVNKGYNVDLRLLIEANGGNLDVELEDEEGKVIKEKKLVKIIGDSLKLNYENIKGSYTIKLKFSGQGVGARIRIKW